MISISSKTNKVIIKSASKLYNSKEKYNMYWKLKYNIKLDKDEECIESKILNLIKC